MDLIKDQIIIKLFKKYGLFMLNVLTRDECRQVIICLPYKEFSSILHEWFFRDSQFVYDSVEFNQYILPTVLHRLYMSKNFEIIKKHYINVFNYFFNYHNRMKQRVHNASI